MPEQPAGASSIGWRKRTHQSYTLLEWLDPSSSTRQRLTAFRVQLSYIFNRSESIQDLQIPLAPALGEMSSAYI